MANLIHSVVGMSEHMRKKMHFFESAGRRAYSPSFPHSCTVSSQIMHHFQVVVICTLQHCKAHVLGDASLCPVSLTFPTPCKTHTSSATPVCHRRSSAQHRASRHMPDIQLVRCTPALGRIIDGGIATYVTPYQGPAPAVGVAACAAPLRP